MSDQADLIDRGDDGLTVELLEALRCPPRWRWFAASDVMADTWAVGPCKTMEQAMDRMLHQIYLGAETMPPTGIVVCIGRRMRKSDLDEGMDDAHAWVIETEHAMHVTLRLDREPKKKGGES